MAIDEPDVLVAGGGIAALTAALFCARSGRSTLVLLGGPVGGGQLLNIGTIEDWPAFPDGLPGYELCPTIQEQAENAGAQLLTSTVERLEPAGRDWRIASDEGDLLARAVILATGSRLRRLGVPGEERLFGKGVSQCATCDGPLLHGRTVAVIGGGDSALIEALELAGHAERVMILTRGQMLSGQRIYAERAVAHPKIEVRCGVVLQEILGEKRVGGVQLCDEAGRPERIDLDAVFVYVGLEPNTGFLSGLLELDRLGRIPTDGALRTGLPGVFAAGDVRSDAANQAVAAAGDGATAAMAADSYLEERQAAGGP